MISIPRLATALPATAQEVVGRITGQLDGEDREWMVYSFPEGAQSDFSDFGMLVDLNILGQPEGAGPVTTENALMLSMTLSVSGDTAKVESAEARYITEGLFKGYATGDPNPPLFEVTTFDKGDGTLSIAGTATGTLGATDRPGLDPDYSDARELSVTFEAELTPPR